MSFFIPISPVFDTLVYLTPGGEFVPGLATSWTFVDDGLELDLRSDVVFHDGTPFDAEAAAANIDRALTLEGSQAVRDMGTFAGVEVLDEMRIKIILTEPDSTVLSVLAGYPGMMISPATFDDPTMDLNPVGAGPFRFVSYQTDNLAVYERFEDYWNSDLDLVDRLEIYFIPDAAVRTVALRSGDLDIAEVAPGEVAVMEAEGFHVESGPTTATLHINFQRVGTIFELEDRAVVAAVNHAIDRQALVDTFYDGLATPATGYFGPHLPYFLEGVDDYFEFDPDRARQILEDAGLSGQELVFTWNTTSEDPGIAVAVQAMLADVGITADVRLGQGQQATAEFQSAEIDALWSLWGGRADPLITINRQLGPAASAHRHLGGLFTPEMEALYSEALQTFDEDARNELVRQISQIVADESNMIPLLWPYKSVAMEPSVQGFQLSGWSVNADDFRGVWMER